MNNWQKIYRTYNESANENEITKKIYEILGNTDTQILAKFPNKLVGKTRATSKFYPVSTQLFTVTEYEDDIPNRKMSVLTVAKQIRYWLSEGCKIVTDIPQKGTLVIEKLGNYWCVFDGPELVTASWTKKQAEEFVSNKVNEDNRDVQEIMNECFDRACEMMIACDGNPDGMIAEYEYRLKQEFPQVCKLTDVYRTNWKIQLAGNKWYGTISVIEHNENIEMHPTIYRLS